MEAVKQFLLENWKIILTLALSVATLIAAIVRGKKAGKSVKEVVVDFLTDKVPSYIRQSEAKGGTAEQKKAYALNLALTEASSQLGHQITVEEADYIVNAIAPKIEDILATPQKKENPSGDKKHVSKYRG